MSSSKDTQPAGAPDEPGLKLRLEEKLGVLDELRLIGYRGYGTDEYLHVNGRLIEGKGESGSPGESRGLLANALVNIRRIDSDEIPGAHLRARFRDEEWDLYTDSEGYFQLNLHLERTLDPGWHEVSFELLDSVKADAAASGTAAALVPSPDAEYLVISDLDDTVIVSSATDVLEQARLTLFHNAGTRTPFPGVAALYRALAGGPDQRGINPIFYLSDSGWNLYDLFVEFLDLHGLPAGPILLRDLAWREGLSPAVGAKHHKLARIRNLLQVYPKLPFVLLGDSGQGDAERYRRIVIENPGRVKAVYIRDVTSGSRDRQVEAIMEDLRRRGVPSLAAGTTLTLAEHMAAHGVVWRTAVDAVGDAE